MWGVRFLLVCTVKIAENRRKGEKGDAEVSGRRR